MPCLEDNESHKIAVEVEQAVDTRNEHHGDDDWHAGPEESPCIANVAPHDAEHGEEESRKSDGGSVGVHWQIARGDGYDVGRGDVHGPSYAPQHEEIGKQVPYIGMEEAV